MDPTLPLLQVKDYNDATDRKTMPGMGGKRVGK